MLPGQPGSLRASLPASHQWTWNSAGRRYSLSPGPLSGYHPRCHSPRRFEESASNTAGMERDGRETVRSQQHTRCHLSTSVDSFSFSAPVFDTQLKRPRSWCKELRGLPHRIAPTESCLQSNNLLEGMPWPERRTPWGVGGEGRGTDPVEREDAN